MGEVILSMTNIHKAFGPVKALRSAALDLRRGEIHALAGENGAGKSTLMHIIDGILQPDGGEILLDGKPVKISSPNVANRLGIGPQGYGGDTTAFGIHLLTYPCHITSLPVAVTIECHAHRHKEAAL